MQHLRRSWVNMKVLLLAVRRPKSMNFCKGIRNRRSRSSDVSRMSIPHFVSKILGIRAGNNRLEAIRWANRFESRIDWVWRIENKRGSIRPWSRRPVHEHIAQHTTLSQVHYVWILTAVGFLWRVRELYIFETL